MERWPISVHALASVEITEAASWYRDIDESLSNDFCSALDTAMDRISRSPHRWPVYIDEFRHVLLDQFPYLVVYRVQKSDIQIIAIAHTKRRPGFWRMRE